MEAESGSEQVYTFQTTNFDAITCQRGEGCDPIDGMTWANITCQQAVSPEQAHTAALVCHGLRLVLEREEGGTYPAVTCNMEIIRFEPGA